MTASSPEIATGDSQPAESSASQSASPRKAEPSPRSCSSHKYSSTHPGPAETPPRPPSPRDTGSAAYRSSIPASAQTHPTTSRRSSVAKPQAGSLWPDRSPTVPADPAVADPSQHL